MTIEEFKKVVIKSNWYGKYIEYFFASCITLLGIFFTAYLLPKNINTFSFLFSLILFLAGFYSFLLIKNRYKIIFVTNNLDVKKKEIVIQKILEKLNISHAENTPDTFFTFSFQRNSLSMIYFVYINVDEEQFYFTIIGRNFSGLRFGFIDLGQTEKFRRKIVSLIKSEIAI
jgi:hypothetical protein